MQLKKREAERAQLFHELEESKKKEAPPPPAESASDAIVKKVKELLQTQEGVNMSVIPFVASMKKLIHGEETE